MTTDTKRYGLEYWHPWFRWMRWEPGDKTDSREGAEQAAKRERSCGARVRIVEAWGEKE